MILGLHFQLYALFAMGEAIILEYIVVLSAAVLVMEIGTLVRLMAVMLRTMAKALIFNRVYLVDSDTSV